MQYQTRVKLFIDGAPTEWIVGAVVCLYDRDRISRDDSLGSNITNAYGEADFTFDEADFLDVDDFLGGALPELYVKVFDSAGQCAISTRGIALSNHVPPLIRVPVERQIAKRHNLI